VINFNMLLLGNLHCSQLNDERFIWTKYFRKINISIRALSGRQPLPGSLLSCSIRTLLMSPITAGSTVTCVTQFTHAQGVYVIHLNHTSIRTGIHHKL